MNNLVVDYIASRQDGKSKTKLTYKNSSKIIQIIKRGDQVKKGRYHTTK